MSARTVGPVSSGGDRTAFAAAALALLLGGVTLVGYLLHSERLIELIPGQAVMAPLTSVLCFALAAALVAEIRRAPRVERVIGFAVLIGSAAILASHIVTGRDLFDQALFRVPRKGFPMPQCSIAAAASATCLALRCLRRFSRTVGALLTGMVIVTSSLALLGYVYGVHDLYALSPFRTLSLRSAICFLALGLGFLLQDNRNHVAALLWARGATGAATRRQITFLALVPLAGLFLVRAMTGAMLGQAAVMAIFVVLTIAPLAILILRDSQVLTARDAERDVARDVEAQKLFAEKRYGLLFNSLETGFCVIEVSFDNADRATDFQFLEVNRAFEAQTGVDRAQGRWMREIAPEHEQFWFDTYGEVVRTGRPIRFEHEAKALGRFFEVSAFRVDEPERRRVAILFSDITQRRVAEAELQELNETLERRVAERAEELERTQEALRQSQKLEAIGQLTGGVAHDFNNLLTVIRGSVELLKRPGLPQARQARYLDAIGETAERASKLTGQLLAFARRQALRPERFDVGCSLAEVMGILVSLTGSRVRIDLDPGEVPFFVQTDRSQFDTAIINMVVNARDAMSGEGRIQITCTGHSSTPAVRSHPAMAGDVVQIAISDSGSGIASADLARVFEPFYTTKGVGTGTGLGLSQVFGFAKQSGGDVDVDSFPGEGATFRLYLPRASGDGEAVLAKAPVAETDGVVVCVLVVEDNAEVGTFATEALKELGYDSVLATDATAALALLAAPSSQFDIVFSDVIMPGMSGLELGAEVRTRHPEIPVLLTSGYSHVLAQEGVQGIDLLSKPYSLNQLSQALSSALAGSKVQPSS